MNGPVVHGVGRRGNLPFRIAPGGVSPAIGQGLAEAPGRAQTVHGPAVGEEVGGGVGVPQQDHPHRPGRIRVFGNLHHEEESRRSPEHDGKRGEGKKGLGDEDDTSPVRGGRIGLFRFGGDGLRMRLALDVLPGHVLFRQEQHVIL